MDNADFVFAPAICYEIIFSDSLVPRVELQPSAIINITNDTWFGKTPGSYQHLDMVRRYAIESGLPIIRANYSGISAFILPSGEIVSSLPIDQTGVLDGTVWGAHMTPYRMIGRDGWLIIILLISCIGAICMNAPQKKD
jgi:apolipoprotein N-acyltransferase